jgi:F-type H+-transporting ATPase subunit delta
MIVTTLNRRYAKSFLDLAVEKNALEQVKDDMAFILEVIEASKELRTMLKSPVINHDKKSAVLEAVIGPTVSEITNSFIKVILRKGRESQLEGIAHGFRNLYRQHHGIEEAIITSAQPLTEAQKEDIRTKLKGVTGNAIEIKEIIDPSIIGGVKIRVGDRQYNGSLAYQLEQLKRQFQENQYIADF